MEMILHNLPKVSEIDILLRRSCITGRNGVVPSPNDRRGTTSVRTGKTSSAKENA